jgi:hypothetical protein
MRSRASHEREAVGASGRSRANFSRFRVACRRMRGSPAALRCRWKAVETGFGVERRPILAADAVVVIRGPECQPFRELGLAMRAQRLHRGLVERHRLVARLGSFEAVYAGRDTGRAMSQENVEILYRLFEASRRRDKAACVRDSHPDVEIVSYLMGLEGTVYKGHAGMRRYIDGSSDVAGERGGCAPNPGRCAGLHLARRLAARLPCRSATEAGWRKTDCPNAGWPH